MPRRVFVSYKYGDDNVRPLESIWPYRTTARAYVDSLHELLNEDDHIYLGENDDESLEGFKDETIASKLRSKIFSTSTTIVLISPQMKNPALADTDQWIPWEISWSLRRSTRSGRTSAMNALLAVVLPDRNGSYEYFYQHDVCPYYEATMLLTEQLFDILKKNMFNRYETRLSVCQNHALGAAPHVGNDHSYIFQVEWDTFAIDVGRSIEVAKAIAARSHEYEISKTP